MSRRPVRRRDSTRPYVVVLAGLLTVGAVLLLMVIGVRAPNGVPGVPYRTYYALVPDPGNIQPHNDVRIGGVRVGQVIKTTTRDQQALVELQLDPGTEDLPRDTKVFVRAAGLLGQRYVELRPGSSPEELAEEATIRGGEDTLTYGIPDALNTFDEETREGMARTLDGLGRGLMGRGRGLNDLFGDAIVAGPQFRTFVDQVLTERPGAVRRLPPSLRDAVVPLEDSKADQVAAYGPAARTFDAVESRREALEQGLDEMPPTLRAAAPAMREGRRLLSAARTLSTAAADVLPRAPRALGLTTSLLRESREPLGRASSLLRVAQDSVPDARRLVLSARPVLDPVRRALDDATRLLDTVAEHGCDVDNFAENWRSALGYGIEGRGQSEPLPNGYIGPLHFFRITPPFSPWSGIQGVSKDNPQAKKDPYPAPCTYSPGGSYIETPRGPGR